MATASLVLGIIAVVFSFIPVVGAFIAIPCGIIGLILSVIVFATRKEGQGKAMAIAGGILSLISIVLAILFVVLVFAAVDEAVEDLNELSTNPEKLQEAVEGLSDFLANDEGRAFMLRQPCTDVMAEYNAMKDLGHDAAVMQVSNVYNIKTGGNPYIAVSDAAARVEQCR